LLLLCSRSPQWLRKTKRKAMLAALEKIREGTTAISSLRLTCGAIDYHVGRCLLATLKPECFRVLNRWTGLVLLHF
jgi:hypothetical protein